MRNLKDFCFNNSNDGDGRGIITENRTKNYISTLKPKQFDEVFNVSFQNQKRKLCSFLWAVKKRNVEYFQESSRNVTAMFYDKNERFTVIEKVINFQSVTKS